MQRPASLDEICQIARTAGDEILKIYRDSTLFAQVDFKSDDSPLTLADRRSHEIICEALAQLTPTIPILSEEGVAEENAVRLGWETFWLIDPLDGTKEFINRNDEFTVNIALVHDRKPVLGVVHAPALGKTYFGSQQDGAFLQEANNQPVELKVNNRSQNRIGVRSKSHASTEEEAVLEAYNVTECLSIGSSLKFCLVAEGKADVYYRHGPTMEWDVAAGQAVVEAAGGQVFVGTGPEHFVLNKRELLNGSFLCLGCEYLQV